MWGVCVCVCVCVCEAFLRLNSINDFPPITGAAKHRARPSPQTLTKRWRWSWSWIVKTWGGTVCGSSRSWRTGIFTLRTTRILTLLPSFCFVCQKVPQLLCSEKCWSWVSNREEMRVLVSPPTTHTHTFRLHSVLFDCIFMMFLFLWPDKGSPFILLTLRHPVEGMEGALLRSLLDIDCLNSLSREKFFLDGDRVSCLEDFHSPILSLDDSVELIRRTGLDSHLLSLLGLETGDSNADSDRDGSHCDTDDNATPGIQPEVESQKESEPEPERDAGTRLKPEEGQKEKELQHQPQVSRSRVFKTKQYRTHAYYNWSWPVN